jgi:hypothetical protein
MSAAHPLRALVLCVLLGFSSSLAVQQAWAANDPATSCFGLLLGWDPDTTTPDLADRGCLAVRIAGLFEYASCWPHPSASLEPSGPHGNAFALLSFHETAPASEATGCLAQRDCLCMVLRLDGWTPSLTITSDLYGHCMGPDPNPPGGRAAYRGTCAKSRTSAAYLYIPSLLAKRKATRSDLVAPSADLSST